MARSSTTSRTSAIRNRAHRNRVARALIPALALALAGCGSQTGGMADWGQVVGIVSDQFGPSPSITLQQAAAVPFASLGVRIGDESQRMVVLAANTGGDLLWTSVAKLAITTRGGRIVRTAGLPLNVDTVRFQDATDPLLAAAQGGPPRQSLRFADYWDLNIYSVPIRCVTASRGPDSVVILGRSISVTKVEESCEGSTLDWTFTDTFWVSSGGLVWKSIQHIHPNGDPIETELLRPPAGTP
jgi:hypothetical protein